MKKIELVDIVTAVVMAYPERFKEESIPGLVTAWYAFFKDDDARIVEIAVTKHISVNKWPPSIAEVREQMINLTRPDIIPPDIAWTAVSDLLHAKSEYEHFDLYAVLPEPVARVVETIGWSNLYNLHCGRHRGNKDGMDRVAFMDLYKPAYEREREQAMLPERIKNICEKKRQEIGGESLRLIEKAHEERVKHDEYWDNITGRNFANTLDAHETKLLGGSENEA